MTQYTELALPTVPLNSTVSEQIANQFHLVIHDLYARLSGDWNHPTKLNPFLYLITAKNLPAIQNYVYSDLVTIFVRMRMSTCTSEHVHSWIHVNLGSLSQARTVLVQEAVYSNSVSPPPRAMSPEELRGAVKRFLLVFDSRKMDLDIYSTDEDLSLESRHLEHLQCYLPILKVMEKFPTLTVGELRKIARYFGAQYLRLLTSDEDGVFWDRFATGNDLLDFINEGPTPLINENEDENYELFIDVSLISDAAFVGLFNSMSDDLRKSFELDYLEHPTKLPENINLGDLIVSLRSRKGLRPPIEEIHLGFQTRHSYDPRPGKDNTIFFNWVKHILRYQYDSFLDHQSQRFWARIHANCMWNFQCISYLNDYLEKPFQDAHSFRDFLGHVRFWSQSAIEEEADNFSHTKAQQLMNELVKYASTPFLKRKLLAEVTLELNRQDKFCQICGSLGFYERDCRPFVHNYSSCPFKGEFPDTDWEQAISNGDLRYFLLRKLNPASVSKKRKHWTKNRTAKKQKKDIPNSESK